jgi:RNA polymerase sigma factor (sigma-70 family)
MRDLLFLMQETELIPHLFRTEFRKITSVLCKTLGLHRMEEAEDIVSETFLAAMEVWPYKGLPPNPTAWLYAVAKNRTKNYLRRKALFIEKIAESLVNDECALEETSLDLSEQNITDSQLQMLFAVCHPSLQPEAQIGLALRILCGFGIDEIADAFLTNKETINKRLFRAREKLRDDKVTIGFPAEDEIHARLENVLTTLYLLFNEGYYSESNDAVLREDLCVEAMRLAHLLIDNPKTYLPQVNALLALMCFHASRFPARKNERGEMVLYDEQDITLWNQSLISSGVIYLHEAAQGTSLTKYHLEATIAFWHTRKEDTKEKWETILQLYNKLLQVEYSPVAALNRTCALAKANGNREAIVEAEKLQLVNNHYYYTLLGELYKEIDPAKARLHFQRAVELAKSQADKRVISRKLELLMISPRQQ